MPPKAWLTPVLCSAFIAAGASVAEAQSISISGTVNVNRDPPRDSSLDGYAISYQDCLDNVQFTFPLSVDQYNQHTFEVWVVDGTDDCSSNDARHGTAPICWLAYSGTPDNHLPQIVLKSQDLIRGPNPDDTTSAQNTGTAADCDAQATSSLSQKLNIIFMQFDGSDQVSSLSWTDASYDLRGPDAPTDVKAGVGERQVPLTWTGSSTSGDIVGYRFYCAPSEGPGSSASTQALTGIAPFAQTVTDGSSGSSGQAGAESAGMSGSSDAGGGSSGSSDVAVGGASQAEINPDCPTTALVPGSIPDEQYACGSVGSLSESGTAKGSLQNDTLYAVGVAAVDSIGNVGPLSSVACATPRAIDGYYELYRRAGGAGGGGFCSIGHGQARGVSWLLLLAGLAWCQRRRRATGNPQGGLG